MNLAERECELGKRLAYPYRWGRKQNDADDKTTNFVYYVERFDEVLRRIERDFKAAPRYDEMLNYALNRWYNFWSARAVEEIFCGMPGVVPAKERDRLVDFSIQGVRFDHKTSVFPRRYPRGLHYARSCTSELIEWLYQNQ